MFFRGTRARAQCFLRRRRDRYSIDHRLSNKQIRASAVAHRFATIASKYFTRRIAEKVSIAGSVAKASSRPLADPQYAFGSIQDTVRRSKPRGQSDLRASNKTSSTTHPASVVLGLG